MIDARLDEDALRRSAREIVTEVLAVTGKAITKHTKGLERDLESATKQAAGGNLWRSWKSAVFPRGGRPSYSPKGEVFLNGSNRTRGAMTYWSEPGFTRARSGKYLAIPTDQAGVNNRTRSMTPRDWEQRTGRSLFFVRGRGGKAARLVARTLVNGRRVDQTIFILIPQQKFANRFAIEPLHARRQKLLEDDVQGELDRISDR